MYMLCLTLIVKSDCRKLAEKLCVLGTGCPRGSCETNPLLMRKNKVGIKSLCNRCTELNTISKTEYYFLTNRQYEVSLTTMNENMYLLIAKHLVGYGYVCW